MHRPAVSRRLAALAGVWAGTCAVALSAFAGSPGPAAWAGAALPGPLASQGNTTAGFARALGAWPFAFPRDHGEHPAFRQEWWYVTGNLRAADGERFGFELTFFRFALAPPEAPLTASAAGAGVAAGVSAWRAHEIYMAHFAVSDITQQRFRFAQKLERAALGLAGARTDTLHVWIDDWSLASEEVAGGAGAMSEDLATGGAAPHWRLYAAQEGYALGLELEPRTAPVLNGDRGLSRKADEPSAASYYYSIPRLDAHGQLWRGGRALAVRGEAWLDREWGSGNLSARQVGWDWFGLQLDDGSALMFYALRRRDGSRDPHSAGTWMAASGETRALTDPEVAITMTHEWRNSRGERYPAGWRIRITSLALELTVRPALADQELRTTPRYWEGAVDVSGARAGRTLGGRGYVELVGYAAEH